MKDFRKVGNGHTMSATGMVTQANQPSHLKTVRKFEIHSAFFLRLDIKSVNFDHPSRAHPFANEIAEMFPSSLNRSTLPPSWAEESHLIGKCQSGIVRDDLGGFCLLHMDRAEIDAGKTADLFSVRD